MLLFLTLAIACGATAHYFMQQYARYGERWQLVSAAIFVLCGLGEVSLIFIT